MIRIWCLGCRELFRHAPPDEGAWPARCRLELRLVALGLASPGFLRGALGFGAAAMAVQILVWRLDLRGPGGDLLFLLPAALVAPGIARSRRRRLARWRHPPGLRNPSRTRGG